MPLGPGAGAAAPPFILALAGDPDLRRASCGDAACLIWCILGCNLFKRWNSPPGTRRTTGHLAKPEFRSVSPAAYQTSALRSACSGYPWVSQRHTGERDGSPQSSSIHLGGPAELGTMPSLPCKDLFLGDVKKTRRPLVGGNLITGASSLKATETPFVSRLAKSFNLCRFYKEEAQE